MNSNIYTDLALESHNLAVQRTGGEVQGVSVKENKTENVKITRIEVLNQQGASEIGKPIGTYVTLESQDLQGQNRVIHDEISEVLANELSLLIDFKSLAPDPTIFVVGLGNWNATPDALGPHILNYLMVTRHLFQQAPPELRKGMRSVCALAPGVLGITGIQTAEIIKGVVEMVKPDLIIAIDALAARSVNRLGTTIQLSNTGVSPGSGVGQNRTAINKQSMNIPVVALGVPTVIGASTIVNDALERMLKGNVFSPAEQERFRNLHKDQIRMTIGQVLSNNIGNLIVSPKGVDELIKDVSRIIAGGINVALHPDITADNLSLYL